MIDDLHPWEADRFRAAVEAGEVSVRDATGIRGRRSYWAITFLSSLLSVLAANFLLLCAASYLLSVVTLPPAEAFLDFLRAGVDRSSPIQKTVTSREFIGTVFVGTAIVALLNDLGATVRRFAYVRADRLVVVEWEGGRVVLPGELIDPEEGA